MSLLSLFGFGSSSDDDESQELVWDGGDLELDIDMSQGMFSSWEAQCANCLEEQGLPMGNGSHGICTSHAQQTLQSWRQAHS